MLQDAKSLRGGLKPSDQRHYWLPQLLLLDSAQPQGVISDQPIQNLCRVQSYKKAYRSTLPIMPMVRVWERAAGCRMRGKVPCWQLQHTEVVHNTVL